MAGIDLFDSAGIVKHLKQLGYGGFYSTNLPYMDFSEEIIPIPMTLIIEITSCENIVLT